MNRDLNDTDGVLLIGNSEQNADLQYATGFLAPDPFAFIQTPTESILLMGELEVDRARSQARADQVLSIVPYQQNADDLEPAVTTTLRHFAAVGLALSDLGLQRLLVPAEFPLAGADYLRSSGFDLTVATSPLFPQRAFKAPIEIDAIRDALQAAQSGMETAMSALRSATVDNNGRLVLGGNILTSERMRFLIHRRLLEFDCTARRTIVACGGASCDPHQEGHGPLRVDQPIVIDIFPQSSTTRYFGDITRTVVKGKPDDHLKHMYETVLQGQEHALSRVRNGANAKSIHDGVHELFAAAGFKSGRQNGRMQGFFHGTGHGLGLEIHEAPSISSRHSCLTTGHVVTVEPGLYYANIGGVRIEDVVSITDDGCTVLTDFPKFLQL